jgi:transposase InsO family protein
MSKFAFVLAERANHAVSMLCRVVGVSVSGFYAWRQAIPSNQRRAKADADLREHIGRIFTARRRVYGSPRIHAELRREGRRHSRRRIARLMRDMGLSARQGRRPVHAPPTAATTTRSHPTVWTETSPQTGPIGCGWQMSLILPRTRAGSTWPRSRIWPPARSSAGRWPIT